MLQNTIIARAAFRICISQYLITSAYSSLTSIFLGFRKNLLIFPLDHWYSLDQCSNNRKDHFVAIPSPTNFYPIYSGQPLVNTQPGYIPPTHQSINSDVCLPSPNSSKYTCQLHSSKTKPAPYFQLQSAGIGIFQKFSTLKCNALAHLIQKFLSPEHSC
ncbi:hypothetical protein SLE2022_018170 [Rubroshorea leprosula]